MLRKWNRRAFGCGDVIVRRSTSVTATSWWRRTKAAVSPTRPPPTTSTPHSCVRCTFTCTLYTAPYDAAMSLVWFDEPAPPRSEGLSRERIVAAAIALADADVRGEVTMRAVAARVGSTTPMSLYRY